MFCCGSSWFALPALSIREVVERPDIVRVPNSSSALVGLCQFKGFNPGFDGALFVGYHSKAGTEDGILSHTWIPAFQDVRVNGLSVGEYGLNGFLMSSFGVPVLLMTGDDKAVEQARPLFGEIDYVEVKKSLGYFKGEHLPIAESHARRRDRQWA